MPEDEILLRSIAQVEKKPELLVEMLCIADGNLDKFVKQFSTFRRASKIGIMLRVMLVLNKPENAKVKADFEGVVEAFKQAKIMVAEQTAMNWIADYEPPKPTEKNKEPVALSQAIAYMRVFMGEHVSQQSTKGRLKAAEMPTTTAMTAETAGKAIQDTLEDDA